MDRLAGFLVRAVAPRPRDFPASPIFRRVSLRPSTRRNAGRPSGIGIPSIAICRSGGGSQAGMTDENENAIHGALLAGGWMLACNRSLPPIRRRPESVSPGGRSAQSVLDARCQSVLDA